ncbi:MAG: DUF1573 domain-containing protein [Planctomycetaceae bacterium]|nr:DUF1573 domain-containing protein [Planctomycetaceae bacterium]MBT4725599.1 DUF1573 domain-containing protein [Planctomycetaceae bacterium]MBT5600370.1 DUF1573 domain-containing protein [Planctomycetaceae bacterium]MBT5885033.1 DUF1573 domain-containing protein [Planctomycetaceae bacterium]MBT6848997.1 DUF1573 domain-containing protein [Planctomycetaceae bacterium]
MLSLQKYNRIRNHCALVILTACLSLATLSAQGQDWAKKMFATLEHDFGTVARNSKQQFRFEITNLYKEDVHIASVRASCGCTIPKIETATLKSFEKGSILTTYNTKSFIGQRGATVTVTIDKPFFAEIQLQVAGFIRSDIVFTPNSLEFGEFQLSSKPKKEFNVQYAGRTDWNITDVRSKQAYYNVEILERTVLAGGVEYRMAVELKENVPVGYLKDYLIIVTNDPLNREIQLPLSGKASAPVTLSPAALLLGIVSPDDSIKKRLILRGTESFSITSIRCNHDGVSFESSPKPVANSNAPKKLHIIPVAFQAGPAMEKVQATITVEVEMESGQTIVLTCPLSATVE